MGPCLSPIKYDTTLDNYLNFKNLICESARIEPQSAIFLSALLRSNISEYAIQAIPMRLNRQMQFLICLLREIQIVRCRKKRLRYNGKYIGQKSGHSDAGLLQSLSA